MEHTRSILAMLGWYDHRILMGIARYAREANWHLASQYLYDTIVPHNWRGDGFLALHFSSPAQWQFIRRQARRQPTVLIGQNGPDLGGPRVHIDNTAAGRMAAQHFLERGYQSFAYFSPLDSNSSQARCDGFCQTVGAAGHNCAILTPPPAASPARARDLAYTRRWLATRLRALPKPLALFTLDDRIAVQVIEICGDAELPVPQSVAVLGVGNLVVACECSRVPISSVEFDFDQLGFRAAHRLDRLMAGKDPTADLQILPPTGIISRQSTQMVAAIHPNLLRAVQFIKDNFRNPIGIDDVADAALLSRRRLDQLFVGELRRPPAAYILDMRIDAAKSLLRSTNQKASQIARSCGFHNERNLYRSFLKRAGMTPMAFRNLNRTVS
jgi:LacI family transcriptional regulator